MRRAKLRAALPMATTALTAGLLLTLFGAAAFAGKNDAPGVTDTEIKIGQTMPYSGPASAYGVDRQGRGRLFQDDQRAGRRQRPQDQPDQPRRRLQPAQDGRADPPAGRAGAGRLHLPDASAPPTNTAIRKYLNDNKVPQLFVATGASSVERSRAFPWTMGCKPNYQTEAQHLRQVHPAARSPTRRSACSIRTTISARIICTGLQDGLGDKSDEMIVKAASYETTDPTVDSQIVSCRAPAPTCCHRRATPKFAAQAIRKVYDIGWKPLHILNYNVEPRSPRC